MMEEAFANQPSNLEHLASTEPKDRRRGAFGVLARAETEFAGQPELLDRLRDTFVAEWRQVGSRREQLVGPLVVTLTTDEDLLVIESAAMALATQGEDGLTALVDLLEHEDFAVRSKVIIGVGLLDRSSRWAVRRLAAALAREPVWLVKADLIRALGRIGGAEAKMALERLVDQLRVVEQRNEGLFEVAQAALAHLHLEEARDA